LRRTDLTIVRGRVLGSQTQIFDKDSPDQAHAARYTKFSVQPLQVCVHSVRRDTEIRCDKRFLLVVEYRLQNLRFPVGQLELPRERAPGVDRKQQPSQKLGFALRRSRENRGWSVDTVEVPVTLMLPGWGLSTRFRLAGHRRSPGMGRASSSAMGCKYPATRILRIRMADCQFM
jgi:hypothetical protein